MGILQSDRTCRRRDRLTFFSNLQPGLRFDINNHIVWWTLAAIVRALYRAGPHKGYDPTSGIWNRPQWVIHHLLLLFFSSIHAANSPSSAIHRFPLCAVLHWALRPGPDLHPDLPAARALIHLRFLPCIRRHNPRGSQMPCGLLRRCEMGTKALW